MFNNNLQENFLLILTFFSVNAEIAIDLYKQPSKDLDIEDLTRNFTNIELELALGDLSLNDLNTLQILIDSADVQDIDYDDNLMDRNSDADTSYDIDNENIFYNMNSDPEDDVMYDQRSIGNLHKYTNENERSKREDNLLKINEEYIKQLDFSFPQNVKQNNFEMELKKDHIRVKRN